MEKQSSSNFIQRLFSVGQPLPGTSLIFLLVAIISILQLPANILMKSCSFTLGIFFNETVVIAGIPLLVAHCFGFEKSRLFPFKPPKINTLIYAAILAVPVALLIDYAASASESFLPMPARYHDLLNQLMAFEGEGQFLTKLFVLCVLPGICEEIFFRGFCQTSLEIKLGKWKAIIITSALFALLHGNPWYFHLYFLLGFFLSWVFAVSRTLWIPITCHIINNAWTFINNALKIEYPFKNFTGPLDTLIITGALMLFAVFASLFNLSSNRDIFKRR